MNSIPYSLSDEQSFQGNDYRDIRALKEYLHRRKDDANDQDSRHFDFVIQLVSLLSQLRFEAETRHKNNPGIARNRRKELPLPWLDVKNSLLGEDNDTPDQQIITQIAQGELSLLEGLLNEMRKILHRKRQMVSMGNAQQLDAYCLRWLTRQPGRTAVEKAGIRQQIMAVVREESFNTLENRVLKDFVVSCQREAWNYCRQFSDAKYQTHPRLQAVKSLMGICQEFLRRPEIDSLPNLTNLPVPNYVLQYDKRYSRMWERYIQLVNHTRIVEMVWPYRHRLFFECAMAMTVYQIDKAFEGEFRPFFQKTQWLNPFPNEGCFFQAPQWGNLFVCQRNPAKPKMQLQGFPNPKTPNSLSVQFLNDGRLLPRIQFTVVYLFIPQNATDSIIHLSEYKGITIYVIHTERNDINYAWQNHHIIHLLEAKTLLKMREEIKRIPDIMRRELNNDY